VNRAKIKAFGGAIFTKQFDVFDIKYEFDCALTLLLGFGCLMQHQYRATVRRTEFCDAVIIISRGDEVKEGFIEMRGRVDIPHIEENPVQLRVQTWTCPQLIPHPVLIQADNRSNLTGDVPPMAECLRRVL
jgi:hypothetical protein